MECNSCVEKKKQAEPVPWIVYQADMARSERANKRWFIAWLITFTLLLGVIAGVIWYESQFETVVTEETYTSESDDGGIAIVNRDGTVNYGESDLQKDDDIKNP